MTDVCSYWDLCKHARSGDRCRRPECSRRSDVLDYFEKGEYD